MSDKTEKLAEMVVQGAQTYIDAKLAKLTKALKLDERLAAIEKGETGGAPGAQIVSLERRASRHADHLARLETRVQALESGAASTPLQLGHHDVQ